MYDNVFDENIHEFMDNGDVIVLMEDLDEFDRYIKGYELEIVEKDERESKPSKSLYLVKRKVWN